MKNEKLKKIGEKVKSYALKINKKTAIAIGAVLILGIAVLLNFLLVPKTGTATKGKLETAIDLTDVKAAIADAEKSDSSDGAMTDAFSQMSLSRRQARDEAIEMLNSVSASATAVDSMKEEAAGELEAIAKNIECEANIEGLVISKGFEKCVAVVNGDTASIVVKTKGLLENEVAQISEIVWEQAGVRPENLRIIESE